MEKPKSVLILSSRLPFTQNDLNLRLVENGIIFQSYKGLEKLNEAPYLVVQMESLYKIEGNPTYDILLIDESEACLKQFNSKQMDVLWKNLNKFKQIFISAKKKVVLDAFMSNRTIDFVESMLSFYKNVAILLIMSSILIKRFLKSVLAMNIARSLIWMKQLLMASCYVQVSKLIWKN